MFRYKPFTITISHPKEINIQNFILSFSKQLLILQDFDPLSIYSTNLNNITLTGYSQQKLLIVNDIFTNSESIDKQLTNIKLLNSTSVAQVSENKYKEPIFFNSSIIIICTPNLFPHSKNNYNYLVDNSDLCFKYLTNNNKFYRQHRILEPEISSINTDYYYNYRFERNFSYHQENKNLVRIDLGITIDQILDVSNDSYIRHVSRCSKDWQITFNN
jgi:hypothetical protein